MGMRVIANNMTWLEMMAFVDVINMVVEGHQMLPLLDEEAPRTERVRKVM